MVLRTETAAALVSVVAVAAIAVGYGIRLGNDESHWMRAARLQDQILRAVDPMLPRLHSGGTLLTFGSPGEVAPRVPIFDRSWDLWGAVALAKRDVTVNALPVFEGITLRCLRRHVRVEGPDSYGVINAIYRDLHFVDLRTGTYVLVRNARSCTRTRNEFGHSSV
jgi:hypothetical protein